MPWCDVAGLSMYYELHGFPVAATGGEPGTGVPGPDDSGGDATHDLCPTVLIMGLSADISEYTFLIDALAAVQPVVAFDNRGAGRTDKPDVPYSIGMMADDALGLLDALGVHRARFLGISMGGRIALDLAVRHPERVAGLLLVSTQPGARERIHLSLPMRLVWLLRWLPLFPDAYPQPRYAFARQRAASLAYDCSDRLTAVTAPTLILHGVRDRTAPIAEAREMARRIPDARLVTFSGGHLFFLLRERQRFVDTILADSPPATAPSTPRDTGSPVSGDVGDRPGAPARLRVQTPRDTGSSSQSSRERKPERS